MEQQPFLWYRPFTSADCEFASELLEIQYDWLKGVPNAECRLREDLAQLTTLVNIWCYVQMFAAVHACLCRL